MLTPPVSVFFKEHAQTSAPPMSGLAARVSRRSPLLVEDLLRAGGGSGGRLEECP